MQIQITIDSNDPRFGAVVSALSGNSALIADFLPAPTPAPSPTPEPAKPKAKAAKAAPVAEPAEPVTPAADQPKAGTPTNGQSNGHAKALSLEEVRAILHQKAEAGKRPEIKEILTTFGVPRLSELSPEHYSDFAQKLSAL